MTNSVSTAIKYLHLRNLTANGVVDCKGGTTIAYRQSMEGTIEFATAFCNERDNYNKAFGRAKAGGRLNSDRYRFTAVHTDMDQFRQAVLDGEYGV